jgi:hypothetical protein
MIDVTSCLEWSSVSEPMPSSHHMTMLFQAFAVVARMIKADMSVVCLLQTQVLLSSYTDMMMMSMWKRYGMWH